MGTVNGLVQIWDVAAEKKVATLQAHTARVGEYLPLLQYCFFRLCVCVVGMCHAGFIQSGKRGKPLPPNVYACTVLVQFA